MRGGSNEAAISRYRNEGFYLVTLPIYGASVRFIYAQPFYSHAGILSKDLVEKWHGIMKILVAEDYSVRV